MSFNKDDLFKLVSEFAKEGGNQTEFRTKHRTAYNALYIKKWWEEASAVLPRQNFFHSDEQLIKTAKLYPSLKSMRESENQSHKSQFSLIKQRKLTHIAFAHMKKQRVANGHWTKKRVLDVAKSYKTVDYFRNNKSGAYDAAYRNGYIDEVKALIGETKSKSEDKHLMYVIMNKRLNLCYVGQTCQAWATRKSAHLHENNSRHSSKITKLKDTVFQPLGSHEYNAEQIDNMEHKYYDYYGSVGFTMLNDKSQLGSRGSTRLITKKDCKKAALECKTRTEFQKRFSSKYGRARVQGWLDECYEHMPQLINPPGYWNVELCRELAKKCTGRGDFQKRCRAAYMWGQKNRCLEEIYEGILPRQRRVLSKAFCMAEAKKYSSRAELYKADGSLYITLLKRGWLEEACKHMVSK